MQRDTGMFGKNCSPIRSEYFAGLFFGHPRAIVLRVCTRGYPSIRPPALATTAAFSPERKPETRSTAKAGDIRQEVAFRRTANMHAQPQRMLGPRFDARWPPIEGRPSGGRVQALIHVCKPNAAAGPPKTIVRNYH